MTIRPDQIVELKRIFSEVNASSEAGIDYIHITNVKAVIAGNDTAVDILLCPMESAGYTTRMFLSKAFPERQNNWTPHMILGRVWHTPSFNNVPATLPYVHILAAHLRGLK